MVGFVIGFDTRRRRAPPQSPGRPGGRSTTLELIKTLYVQAPHAALYTPLCKVQPVLLGCSYLVSTDGQRLSAVVAYSTNSIEFTWSLAGRAGSLRNLIAQIQHRFGVPQFLPVMETGRRSWSEMLGLPVLDRYFRARLADKPTRRPELPAGFEISDCDPEGDLEQAMELMNAAYPSLRRFMTLPRLREMTHADHYFAPGWFFLVQRPSGKRVGLAISGHDTDMDEGFIDWVQLLPRFRRRGLGTLLVRESIHRLRQARLITVSGTLDAPFAAGDLYRKCGFEQERQWTILGQERRQARDGTAAVPPANGSDKQ